MKTFTLLALAATALAKTDLAGCTSSAIGASLLWYVPSNGEICSILDCGGGRAPPKTTVPGCAAYSGTASYTPSFIPNYNQASATSAPSTPKPTASISASSYTPIVSGVPTPYSSTVTASTLITSKPVAPSSSAPAVGTGGVVGGGNATVTGGNNATAPATPRPSASGPPVNNGVGMNGVAQGVVAVAAGVFAVMML